MCHIDLVPDVKFDVIVVSVCGLCKPVEREEQAPRRTAQYLCRDGSSQRFHPDSNST